MVKSKRKSSDGALTGLSKKRKSADADLNFENQFDDGSVFCTILADSGLVLKKNKHHELSTDPGIFYKKMQQNLRKQHDLQKTCEEFMEGFNEHTDDLSNLHQALLPCEMYEEEGSGKSLHQCLIRLLFSVQSLQHVVMERLLEKLAEFDSDIVDVDRFGKVNLAQLILNQFRWLDRIVNSHSLVEKMFEVLGVTIGTVQAEIISCIPEVVEDSQHSNITSRLMELLSENNDLAVPILDALSNLNIKPDLLTQVRQSVIEVLRSAALVDLPVMLRFLLQSLSLNDSLEVIQDIRQNLDLESSVTSTVTSSSRHTDRHDKQVEKSCSTLIVDTIRSAIRFQKHVSDAWLKALETATPGYKALDILVLLVLHSCGQHRAVETLCRQKIRSNKLPLQLVKNTIASHKQVLREYFNPLLSLAEVFLRSPEPAISHFAEAIYTQSFLHFDTYCKQEIVGTLVTHIGSGFMAEVNSSLSILLYLVENHTHAMEPFSVFIKGVLDYVDNLSIGQIRKLYCMLSTLTFRGSQGASSIQDELYIIIRKQLSNSEIKYQRMGVLGAIMVVRSLAYKSEAAVFSQDSEQGMSDEALQQAISQLQLIRSTVNREPQAIGLFLDELAALINAGSVHQRLEKWISENVISDFQDDFIADFEAGETQGDDPLPWKLQYNLDDEGEGAILVPLLTLLNKKSQSAENKFVSAMCLPSHFRLLHVCESRQHEGNLEGIDALLGCMTMMPDLTLVDKLTSLNKAEIQLFVHSLFLLINWFRELLNAFGTQETAEMKAKVISRLQSITELQLVLQKALAVSPQTLPPPANFDQDDQITAPPTSLLNKKAPKATKAGKKKSSKKSKAGKSTKDADATVGESQANESTIDETLGDPYEFNTSPSSSDEPQCVDLTVYRGYFRELDLPVFSILKFGFITQAALDTNLNTKDTTTLQLHPPQLVFLLEDLSAKLTHALLAKRPSFLKLAKGGRQRSGFSHLEELGPEKVVHQVTSLIPALCNHLEATSGFFQALIDANDGVVDGPGHNTEEARLMSSSLHLLLQILQSLFSWNGFTEKKHHDLLCEALAHLASRTNPSSSTKQPQQELFKQAFHYLENFSSTMPDLPSAVTLCRLLVALSDRADQDDLAAKIGGLTESFMKRDWTDCDGQRGKGAKHNEQIQNLVKLYFEYQEDMLASLEWLCSVALPELIEADKHGGSTSVAILTRNSFGVFYRVMLHELVKSIKALNPGKTSDSTQVKVRCLLQWNRAVRIFHVLVNIVKALDARVILGTALKWGRQFVEVFLRQGMPLLDHAFTKHKDDVQSLLKNLQLSTRTLHHMCGHSKILKDVSLTNQVPPLKRVLEQFVYRVKAMLTMNRCHEAFWLGNLKNRDLKGAEILSQSSQRTDSSDEETDDVPDDTSDDESDRVSSVDDGDGQDEEADSDDADSYSETY